MMLVLGGCGRSSETTLVSKQEITVKEYATSSGLTINYYIITPARNSSNILNVYLHDDDCKKQTQDENITHLLKENSLPAALVNTEVYLPYYYLIPELPYGVTDWTSIMPDLEELIQTVLNSKKLTKVSITGAFMGGEASFIYAKRNPQKCYKVSSVGALLEATDEEAILLQKVGFWAVVADDKVEEMQTTYDKLYALNQKAQLTSTQETKLLNYYKLNDWEFLKWLTA